ncbi:hypothetical protein J1N35_018579 [Gossypium stocksii]|uniref:Non-haem dioxygenase N-terminal domain-containing protein n=1 Tax=Gossypium stocksii TaxID=47602 RepID=A0A9D3VQ48_9ROSI|nr:hypothetical protein J1N35_018579 [Gossypium stocksii]
MFASFTRDSGTQTPTTYDRFQELKAFDDSKSGVKGLVDAGITKIPRIFCRPKVEDHDSVKPIPTQFTIPVINLENIKTRSDEVVEGIRKAGGEVGFFQVVNHGVPQSVLEEMLAAARGFHELPTEIKKLYYTREKMKKVIYGRLDCSKGHCLLSHYYPACPEPELTLGTTKHSDPDFLTILLRDHIGGLKFFIKISGLMFPFCLGLWLLTFEISYRYWQMRKAPECQWHAFSLHICTLQPGSMDQPIKELSSKENPTVRPQLKTSLVTMIPKDLMRNLHLHTSSCNLSSPSLFSFLRI